MPEVKHERTGRSAISVRFSIPGEPAPKGSKSVSRSGHMYEQSRYLPGWNKAAIKALADSVSLEPPYRVKATFVCERPKTSKWNWPVRGDLDKYQRALGDALQAAGVIADDKHIIQWEPVKLYGTVPRTYGCVETVEGYGGPVV